MSDKDFEDSKESSAFAVSVYQNPAPAALVVELDNAEPVQCAERVKNESNQGIKIDIISESVDVIFDYVFKIRSESHEMYKDMLERLREIEETRAADSEAINKRLNSINKSLAQKATKQDFELLRQEIQTVSTNLQDEMSRLREDNDTQFVALDKKLNQILQKI